MAENITPVFLPGKFHGQRTLVSYSPWGHEESDTAEHTGALPPLSFMNHCKSPAEQYVSRISA